jgi:hypothetical protein
MKNNKRVGIVFFKGDMQLGRDQQLKDLLKI